MSNFANGEKKVDFIHLINTLVRFLCQKKSFGEVCFLLNFFFAKISSKKNCTRTALSLHCGKRPIQMHLKLGKVVQNPLLDLKS